MQEITLSDSQDNEVSLKISMTNSIKNSFQPKLISFIQKTHLLASKSLPKIKKIQSFSSLTNQRSLSPEIKKAINMIKDTTVIAESPISVIQLFQKTQKLCKIKHKSKKTIQFFEIFQGHHSNLMIEKNEWHHFSNFNGYGMLILPDGRKIKGVWYQAVPFRKMTVQYPNQSLYYGELNDQLQKEGDGLIYFKNGQKLEGHFHKGSLIGRGRFYNSKGDIQSGFLFMNGPLVGLGSIKT